MCVQIFHMVNIDVPAGVGAPPLDTTTYCDMQYHLPLHGCSHQSQADDLAGLQSVGALLSAPDCLCILAADSVLQLTSNTGPHK